MELISAGCRSSVYRARPANSRHDWPADYVVKLLDDRHLEDPLNVHLIQREAFVGRQTTQPHLAPVLAAHVDHPPYFLVTPHLSGGTLHGLFEEGASRPTTVALWITRQVAEALRELHRCGWLHGDVKPANIIVSPDGHTTLIDLGFARRCGLLPADENSFRGTPAYAAPEHFCRAQPLSGTTDIYSLGATLFEMLVGRPPFVDVNPALIAAAHLQDIPQDIRHLAPHIPLRAGRMLARMLAKDPLRRPTADELVATLIDLEIETFDDRCWAA